MELTKINRDVNGNPRYVVHFLEFINNDEKGSVSEKYALALKKAKKIGGKKYNNKSYGGGIVFQSYNTNDLIKKIKELKEQNFYKGMKAPATSPKKRKKVISARKICRTVIDVPGINKRTGQLLKGWHYVKGKPVKVTKVTTTKKRGLKSPLSKSDFPGQCPICRTTDGGIYVPASGYNCNFKAGDRCLTRLAKPATKKNTTKQTAAQTAFRVNAAKARQLVASGKARTLKDAWEMLKK